MSGLFGVLMAGGSGTRFWPASRVRRPKQLLPIGGDEPLLALTSHRLGDVIPPERQLIVTSARYVDQVRAMLTEVPPEQVIGEPKGRDTAACIGLAGRLVERLDPDATVVAMPSDHVIRPVETFLAHLRAAEEALDEAPESILVFGVEPDRPATGYGYLRRGDAVGERGGCPVHRLDAFVEKPDEERAKEMLAAGGHSWNAGLFAFRAAALRTAYQKHLPSMTASLDRIAASYLRDEFDQVLAAEFPKLEKTSIDYGVMEKLDDALLMPLPVQWDDVGAWDALARLAEADEAGNVVSGDAVGVESRGNILSASDGGVVAVHGVEGLIVVHTPDATMVCRRDDAQGVKKITEALKARGYDAFL